MSDSKTLGLACSYTDAAGHICGRQQGTRKDPWQTRYDIGLCPAHMHSLIAWGEIAAVKEQHPHLRMGQIAYNLLCERRPDLAEKIVGTDIDPFYDSLRLGDFLEWVLDQP